MDPSRVDCGVLIKATHSSVALGSPLHSQVYWLDTRWWVEVSYLANCIYASISDEKVLDEGDHPKDI